MPQIYQSNKQRKETDWSGAAENAMAVTTRAVEQSKRNAMAANKLASLLRQDPKRYAGVKATIGEDGELTGNDKLANSMVARLVRHQRDSDNFKNTKLYDENQYKADLKTNDALNKQVVDSKLNVINYGNKRIAGLDANGIPDPDHVNKDFFSAGMGTGASKTTNKVLDKEIAAMAGLDQFGNVVNDANGQPSTSMTPDEIKAFMEQEGRAPNSHELMNNNTYQKDAKTERESKGGGYSYTYENNLSIDGQLKPDTISEEQVKEGFDRTSYEEDYAMFMRGIDDVISMAGTGNAAASSTWDDQIKKSQEIEKEISAILGKDAYGSSFTAGERPTIKGSVKFSEDTKDNRSITNINTNVTGAVNREGSNNESPTMGGLYDKNGNNLSALFDANGNLKSHATNLESDLVYDKTKPNGKGGYYFKDGPTMEKDFKFALQQLRPGQDVQAYNENGVMFLKVGGKKVAELTNGYRTLNVLPGTPYDIAAGLQGNIGGSLKTGAQDNKARDGEQTRR